LGIDEKRFAKELDKLIKYPNVNLVISAENINKNYEVVRAGNTWQRFETNLLEIQKHNIYNLCKLRENNFYQQFLKTF
jgi:hypothetical protein